MAMKHKIHKKKLFVANKRDLIEKAAAVLQPKEYILFAYIFGSFIAETSVNDIDIGLFIHGENPKSLLTLEFELELELENTIGFPVDIRIINNAPVSFIYNVLKSGVVIVDKNISLRADFEGLICKKYFDYKHLRDEYLREIINAAV